MTICICASIIFYDRFESVVDELKAMGHDVSFPTLDDDTKAEAMHKHFHKIEESDAVLVLNYTKHGTQNYIGANVFLEIGYAFARRKPVFLIGELPSDSPYIDELNALSPTALRGDLKSISMN